MAKVKKQVSFEDALWGACDKLRGTVEPAEYKHVVLSLIFLKFVNDKFEARRQELKYEGKEKYIDVQSFYTMKNVFFVPEESRWSFIMQNAKQNDIALKIDTALNTIEKQNPSLKGALPDNYYSRLGIDVSKLAALLDEINNIQTNADKENDIMGRVYEYFLTKFALQEGKGKGEFYTPKSVVNLIAEMIEPYKGKIYDPCCGSGGMFVQSLKFVENHAGNSKDISVYGQEGTTTTYKLAKMNLAIRGIPCDLGEKAANTFTNDLHKDLRADYIMANPPFNQKDWRAENELVNDARWNGYTVPPTSNANYGWILHMVSKLSTNGTAGFLLANGALSGEGQELEIRKQLIENNLVEAIVILPRNLFYTTDISVTLWILNKNKKSRTVEQNGKIKNYRNREEEVLFMDLRQMGSPFEKKYIELTQEDRDKVTSTFHAWQQVGVNETYKNIPEFCYSANKKEIAEKGYNLVPSRYIEFVNRDETQDYDSAMKALQSELTDLLKQEEESKKELLGVFKDLGYEIKLQKMLSHGLDFANAKSLGEQMLLYEKETEKILKACFEVHNELGNGFLEAVYQEALEKEFIIQKIPYEREKLLPIMYKGEMLSKEYYADFVCYDKIIVELKAVTALVKAHKAQVINYLKADDKEIGLLVNFGCNSLKWERISKFENRENRQIFRIRVI